MSRKLAVSGMIAGTLRALLAAIVTGSGMFAANASRIVHAQGPDTDLSVAALPVGAVPVSQVIPWQPWGTVPGTPKTSTGARVAALYKDSSHLDLFSTDASGAITSTFWEEGGWHSWFQIHPETKAAPGSPVTALYKDASHLDAFTTDSSGAVISSFWEKGVWQPWFQIHPETRAAPGTAVMALYRDTSHLDVFMTDGTGTIMSSYWEPNGGWRPWFQIHPETKAAPGSPVTAVYKDASHLDAFTTDISGAVISSYWAGDGGGWRPWFQIHPETKAAPGSPVTAVYKDASHLDTFATDSSGAVISSFWEPSGAWRPWFQIHPETKVAPGSPVTAVYKDPGHLDLFVVGADGQVDTSFWDSHQTVQRIPVDAPTCTQFLRRWRTGVNNDVLLTSCTAFMGIDDWCAKHNSRIYMTNDTSVTGDIQGNRRALICVPDPGSDSAIDQAREIVAGVSEGLADSFVAAAPFISMAAQGYACIDGVVFACATLALDITDQAGAPAPDVVPDMVSAAKQATDCASGDVVACAQLGARGARTAGVSIPGVDPGEVADNAKKCADDDSFIACLRLGKLATDAAGVPAATSAIADANACANGDVGACTNLGRAVATVTKAPLDVSGFLLDGIDNADKCKNSTGPESTDACLALGKSVAAAVVRR